MSYFTAVFKDLPMDELAAIAQDERCRFMSHSHVGHERDELRQRVADLEVERDMLSAGLGIAQGLTGQLAACEKERDELRQKIAALEQRRRDESDDLNYGTHVLMAKTIVQSMLDERDMLKAELDRELRIGTDYMKKLAACEKERDELHQRVAEVDTALQAYSSELQVCVTLEYLIKSHKFLRSLNLELGEARRETLELARKAGYEDGLRRVTQEHFAIQDLRLMTLANIAEILGEQEASK